MIFCSKSFGIYFLTSESVTFSIFGKDSALKLVWKIHRSFKKCNSSLFRFFICFRTDCCILVDIGIGIEGLDNLSESLHNSIDLSFFSSPEIVSSFSASLINKGLPLVFEYIFFNNISGMFLIFIVFRIKASVSASDKLWRFIFFIEV